MDGTRRCCRVVSFAKAIRYTTPKWPDGANRARLGWEKMSRYAKATEQIMKASPWENIMIGKRDYETYRDEEHEIQFPKIDARATKHSDYS